MGFWNTIKAYFSDNAPATPPVHAPIADMSSPAQTIDVKVKTKAPVAKATPKKTAKKTATKKVAPVAKASTPAVKATKKPVAKKAAPVAKATKKAAVKA